MRMSEYRTTDLHLCAYLRAGFQLPLARTLRQLNTRRVTFCLEVPATLDIERLVLEYFAGTASVQVRAFCDEVAALKGLVYSDATRTRQTA